MGAKGRISMFLALHSLLKWLLHCSGLQTLHITGADRLQEEALSMLAPLAATLQELSLQGCHGLRDRAGQHLQALTRLTHLDIGGWRPSLQLSLTRYWPWRHILHHYCAAHSQ